tara:strand:+ start:314 stop:583 length:270 start_codon:yes stop_codon:yes gene_type:complete
VILANEEALKDRFKSIICINVLPKTTINGDEGSIIVFITCDKTLPVDFLKWAETHGCETFAEAVGEGDWMPFTTDDWSEAYPHSNDDEE